MKNPLILAGIAMALSAACSAPQFSVEPTLGRLDAEGDIALTDNGMGSTRNSLDDVGISGDETTFGVRADVEFGAPHVTLATQSASWSGSGNVTDFGGIAGANVAVDSKMDIALHRGVITFDLVPTSMVELGLGLGVSAVDFDAKVQDQGSSAHEEIDEFLPIPVLAVRGGVSVWKLDFQALVSGMSIDLNGDHARFFDTDVSASYRLFGVGPVDARLSVGYRRIDFVAKYDDGGDSARADITLDGLYFGLRIII